MATYYINPTSGDDSTGTGASATPWQSFSKFNSSSTAGDICKTQLGSHTIDATYLDDFIEDRTYEGELDQYGRLGVTLDLNGAVLSNEPIGGSNKTVNIQNFIFKNFNTTSKTLLSVHSMWVFSTSNIAINFTNCRFDGFALGSSGASSTAGWYGNIFGSTFTGSILSSVSVDFTRCSFTRVGTITGSTAGTSGIFGASNGNDNVDVGFNNCLLDLSAPTALSLGAVSHFVGSRDFGSVGQIQTFSGRKNILTTDGSMQLTRHGGDGSNLFTFDFNYSDNVFHTSSGSFSFDASEAQSIANCQTADPQLVDPANGLLDLKTTSPYATL